MTRLLAARIWLERHAVGVLLCGCLLLVAAIFARGIALRMHETAQGRLIRYAFPSAISTWYHGAPPYVIHAAVADRIVKAPVFGNAVLREAVAMPVPDAEPTLLFPADDKGLTDVVSLGFLLFGPNLEGLFFTTVLILLVTVFAFFADFRRSAVHGVAPLIVLGGLYAAMPALRLTAELDSFTNPRAFELLGLIPVVHLVFATVDERGFSWVRLVALAVQAGVIVECIHVRCTALWLVFALVGWYTLTVAVRAGRALVRRRWPDPALQTVLRAAWVPALVLVGVAGLHGYQRLVYPPEYLSTHLRHRILWHNVGIGFGLHPRFAREYKLGINDGSMVNLTVKRVADRHDSERLAAIWGPAQEYAGTMDGWARDYAAYEDEARGVVFDLARRHPRETLELFTYYKPRLALRTLGWAAGLSRFNLARLHLDDQAVCLPSPEEVAARDLHIRPVALGMVGLALILACLGCGIRAASLARQAGAFGLLLAGSFVPAACTYPVLHVMGVGILTATAFVLYGGVLGLVALADVVMARRRSAASADRPG